jgi:DNA-binding NarL/FixJ family response regulator
MPKPRLLLADDHELLVDGLRKILVADFDLVGTASDGRTAVSEFIRLRPDVMLLDIGMPLLNGVEVARQVRRAVPSARIIFVTMQTDRAYIEAAFRAGASGYVLKQAASGDLLDGIHQVLHGRRYISPRIQITPPDVDSGESVSGFAGDLSPRQREVLQLLAEGKAMKEIAAILDISVRTVEFHKTALTRHLGLRTTAELTRYAVAQKIAL